MRRRLFTILSALSLLLCAATLTLWVWSRGGPAGSLSYNWRRVDGLRVSGGNWSLAWDRGEVCGRRQAFVYNFEGDEAGLADYLSSEPPPPRVAVDTELEWAHHIWDLPYEGWRWHGFARLHGGYDIPEDFDGGGAGDRFSDRLLIAPGWLPPAVLAAPCSVWAAAFARRRVRAARRRRAGRCLACGYDLTANASGVCPECGADAGRGSSS